MTEIEYIAQARGDLKLRYDRLTQIIDALELRVLDDAAATANIEQYNLNDGQTIISTRYRSVTEIYTAIQRFETLRNKVANQLNGRKIVLRPWQGFRR